MTMEVDAANGKTKDGSSGIDLSENVASEKGDAVMDGEGEGDGSGDEVRDKDMNHASPGDNAIVPDDGNIPSPNSPLNENNVHDDNDDAPLVEKNGDDDDKNNNAPSSTASAPSADAVEIPKVPPKKSRTAYFIFMAEKRLEVIQQQQDSSEGNKKQSIGDIAKIIGAMWKELDAETKDRYQELARAERETYREQMELYKLHNDDIRENGDGEKNNKARDPNALIFPVARIRKICRLDPDVKNLSKEAVLLVTKCAELFTARLATETNSMAQMQKRRKLIPRDVHDVTSMKEPFLFLKDDIGDLIIQQQNEEKRNGGGNHNGKGKKKVSDKMIAASANTKKLTSFFTKKK